MPSANESSNSGVSRRHARLRVTLERWNRKLHYYSGLFLLFFIWLFAFSGLLLNHSSWRSADFWKNRKDTNIEREIVPPPPLVKGDLAQAHDIMRQLGIEGDILWTTTRTDPARFEFQVRRPGHFFFINADLARMRVTVRRSDVNFWGLIQGLHSFTGVNLTDARQTRDWALTSMWAFSMDAVAAGLIFMVLSSLYMWWELPQKRLPGAVAFGLGVLICGLFCLGLRWLF